MYVCTCMSQSPKPRGIISTTDGLHTHAIVIQHTLHVLSCILQNLMLNFVIQQDVVISTSDLPIPLPMVGLLKRETSAASWTNLLFTCPLTMDASMPPTTHVD